MENTIPIRGRLTARKIKARRAPLAWYVRNYANPRFVLGALAYALAHLFSRVTGIPTMVGKLEATLRTKDGGVIRYGVLSYRVITTAFVDFVVDQLQTETSVFGDFKYHDSGVGSTAENIANADMETTDGESRVSGTQTETSHNVYASVGTISYTTTKAITEHGLFNASTGVTLMDRSVFSAINVVNGDSIQFTYSLTLTAGS